MRLPVELKVRILSYLPAKEIQRARQVCSYFRDLIDEPDNTSLLVLPGQYRSRARLSLYIKNTFWYDECKVDFLECLRRFARHRGISRDISHTFTMIRAFCMVWLEQQPDPEIHHMVFNLRHSFHFLIAHWLIEGHCLLHKKFRLCQDPRWSNWMFDRIRLLWFYNFGAHKVLEKTLDFWIKAVLTSRDSRLIASHVEDHPLLPLWPLHRLDHWRQPSPDAPFTHEFLDGAGSYQAVKQILGLEAMPSCHFLMAYCVSSKWARDLVKDEVFGRPMTALMKTAVLEETYIY